jgi:hypothetical protein
MKSVTVLSLACVLSVMAADLSDNNKHPTVGKAVGGSKHPVSANPSGPIGGGGEDIRLPDNHDSMCGGCVLYNLTADPYEFTNLLSGLQLLVDT